MCYSISRETSGTLPFHSTNVPIEDSWLCHESAVASCFASVPSWAMQSGWRLKFPASLLTVPDMGRLQWSQMIRMSFSLPWKRVHEGGRAPVSLITPYATKATRPRNANLLNNPNEINVGQDRSGEAEESR